MNQTDDKHGAPKGPTFLSCPFCGRNPDPTDPSTLHPTGTVWRDEAEFRSYHSHSERQEGDGLCWVFSCLTESGGCGAEVHGDSEEQAIAAWNRRCAPCVVSEDSDELRGENAVLRDRIAELDAELARIRAAFGVSTNDAVIQHLTDRISALKKADPQPQVDATVESDAPQGGQGGYKAVGSAPRNIEGPAHLCPKPAPGFELDKRGVLVATDRGPSPPCVARPSEEAVLMAQTAIERFGSRRFDKLTLDQADQLRMAREILRLDERNGA